MLLSNPSARNWRHLSPVHVAASCCHVLMGCCEKVQNWRTVIMWRQIDSWANFKLLKFYGGWVLRKCAVTIIILFSYDLIWMCWMWIYSWVYLKLFIYLLPLIIFFYGGGDFWTGKHSWPLTNKIGPSCVCRVGSSFSLWQMEAQNLFGLVRALMGSSRAVRDREREGLRVTCGP